VFLISASSGEIKDKYSWKKKNMNYIAQIANDASKYIDSIIHTTIFDLHTWH
jgi:hypothetical protein